MQCHSYLPLYHLHYDHFVDTNGGSRPLHDSNGNFESVHYNTYVPFIPVAQGNFAYKELLRQTMLIHEDTFKDQVQELHRLYRRQRELMSEIKREELFMNNLQLEVQSSNFPSADLFSRCGQSNMQNFQFHNSQKRPCFVKDDDIQRALSCIRELKKPDSRSASHDDIALDKYPEPKGKIIAGKLLDLELPADVYIESDEWESLGDAQCGGIPNSISLPPDKPAMFVVETNNAASRADSHLGSFLQKGFLACSVQQTNSYLTDLNVPPTTFELEKSDRLIENEKTSEISEKNAVPFWSRNGHANDIAYEESLKPLALSNDTKHEIDIGSGNNLLCNLGTKSLIVQALPSVTNRSQSRKGAQRSKGSVKAKFKALCNSSLDRPVSLVSESKLESVAHFSPIKCFDLNSAGEFASENTSSGKAFNEQVDEGNYRRKDIVTVKLNGVNSFRSLDCYSNRKNKRCRVIDINMSCDATVDDKLFEDDLVRHDDKDSGQMNLRTCVTDERSLSLNRNASEIDLEAPVSPEVEERPPPRGDSEEITIVEGDDSLRKLALVAAEAIVSISSSKSPRLERKDLQDFEAPKSSCLEWFAGLAYSLSIELGNDLTMVRYEDADDFEALTLNLTEMKVEDRWSRNFIDMSNQNNSLSLGGRTRKGRTKRSKKKDFLREVLPSLSSLSRYEVTEDIQRIEGLMEAAGTPWHSKTRRTCKVMVKRPRTTKGQPSPTNLAEVKNLFPMCWGKDSKRPRAQRTAASPSAIMSKWLDFPFLVGRPSQHY